MAAMDEVAIQRAAMRLIVSQKISKDSDIMGLLRDRSALEKIYVETFKAMGMNDVKITNSALYTFLSQAAMLLTEMQAINGKVPAVA